jgi:hypothetical protein
MFSAKRLTQKLRTITEKLFIRPQKSRVGAIDSIFDERN